MAYTPIEYIQSTGTQYIDTGFYANNKTKVEISFTNSEISNEYFFGGRTTWGTKSYSLYFEYYYKFVYQNYAYSDNEKDTEILAITEPPTLILNGESFTGDIPDTYTCEYSMYIFAVNNKGSAYKNASISLKYMKIWDDGTLVFDLIPVLDENNVACLYNKVTGTYLYNAGTGEFIAGSIIAPPTITIGTPSKTKISHVEGCNQSVVTFQSDMALQQWEARATTEGQTIGHGSGLLVESGGSLEANTDATVYVDCTELTNGDTEYTIAVFGQSTDGRWSDG